VILLCLLVALPAVAQTAPLPTDRPTVGLALSGGGARGCSHIGVFEALHELRVPVDAVAGASMGAVVGGFYAAGYSPEGLRVGFEDVDWQSLFSEQPDYGDLALRRKVDERRYGDLELGLTDFKPQLPPALLAGQKLDFLLQALLVRVAGVRDFDRLPTPYRAVATDLADGRSVVLADGDLAEALRASLAIPGVFSPVRRGGVVLVDGGLSNNLPVDVVREMGVDVVIAISTGIGPLEPDTLDVLGVLGQAVGMAGLQTTRRQAEEVDLLVEPELPAVGPIDFSRCSELARLGRQGVLARRADLTPLSVGTAAWERYLAQRRERRLRLGPGAAAGSPDGAYVPPGTGFSPPAVLGTDAPLVGQVRVVGAEEVTEARALRSIRTSPGDPLDLGQVGDDVARLYALGDFETVGVRWERSSTVGDAQGTLDVVYVLSEKSWGPGVLRFGFLVTDDFEGNTHTEVRLGYRRPSLNRLGAEWRLDAEAGRTRGLSTELYQPLDPAGRWFVAPHASERHTIEDLYVDDRKLAEYAAVTTVGGVDLGARLGVDGEARIGLFKGWAEAEVETGPPLLPDLDVNLGGVTASVLVDRLDQPDLPTDGHLLSLVGRSSLRGLGADDDYTRIELVAVLHESFGAGERNGAFLHLAGGASPGSELPPYDAFRLGGILSLSGFGEGQLRGDAYAVVRLGASRRLLELPGQFASRVELVSWVEAGNVFADDSAADVSDLLWAGTVALALDTRLGPVYVAYGLAETGQDRVYAAVGKRF
jgi:NTE family protein